MEVITIYDHSDLYTDFRLQLITREIAGNTTATLYNVKSNTAWYRFTHGDKTYEVGFEFCNCGKSSCVEADHDMTLNTLFDIN